MNQNSKPEKIASLEDLARNLRAELSAPEVEEEKKVKKQAPALILIFAYNRTGKTRLTMEFKDEGKRGSGGGPDTLYYNAFTEDLFTWNNDLENDAVRHLRMNVESSFFGGNSYLKLEDGIRQRLHRYAGFDFRFGKNKGGRFVAFKKGKKANIKISRGEENLFVFCFFMAICESVAKGAKGYDWVKYIYIDDPISSLDDQNAIAVAGDLGELIKTVGTTTPKGKSIQFVISSHHSLFFNVLCNATKKLNQRRYFLHRVEGAESLTRRATDETPFFQHLAVLADLKSASETGKLRKHHFNELRGVLEKTACFFGYESLVGCFKDQAEGTRLVQTLHVESHSQYSLFEPQAMSPRQEADFTDILTAFLNGFHFRLPKV